MDMNVVGSALIATQGDIFLDPVLRIEDADFELYSIGASYIRTFEWLGKSSRIDFRVPYSNGRWEGIVNGSDVSTRRHGFGDPRIRFSMNLYGAPPLKGKPFMEYRVGNPISTTVGAALSVTLPLGEYYPDRLINLGGNRYIVRPQLGVLHTRGPWQFEATTTIAFFENNDEFFGGATLEQDPLWFFEGHIVHSFSRNRWMSLSGGYSYEGEGQLNGNSQNNQQRTRYWALSFGMPISRTQNIKLTYIDARTNVIVGSSSDSLILSWSMNWFSN